MLELKFLESTAQLYMGVIFIPVESDIEFENYLTEATKVENKNERTQ